MMLKIKNSIKIVRASFYGITSMLLVGCVVPQEVKNSEFSDVSVFSNGVERYVTQNKPISLIPKTVKRNVIYIFGDELFTATLNPKIQEVYKNENMNLEKLVWWKYAPLLKQIYTKIYRIPQNKLGHQELISTILELERQKESYDLVILTHGYPGTLTTGTDYYFSTEEFQLLPQLKYLNLVYMQACYSSSLMQHWINKGAKWVIGYDGANENIFWFYYFLRWYRHYPEAIERNFRHNNQEYKIDISSAPIFREGIKLLGMDPEEYLRSVDDPLLMHRK